MGDDQRHPMLRVMWKPDAAPGALDSSGLARYLDTFSLGPTSDIVDEGLQKLLGCVHLLSHKNTSLRILKIGAFQVQVKQCSACCTAVLRSRDFYLIA